MKRNNFLFVALTAACTLLYSCGTKVGIQVPGKTGQNKVLLSNGWKLSPAGNQIPVGDLPLNMIVSPDSKYAILTNNGAGKQSIQVLDIAGNKVVQTVELSKAYLGISFYDKGKKLAVSGGNDSKVFLYDFRAGLLSLADSIVLGAPWPKDKLWLSGISVDDKNSVMYVTAKEIDALFAIDIDSKKVIKKVSLPSKPYTCLVSSKNSWVYVSLWGGRQVAVLNKTTLEIEKLIPTGSHPNDMVESKDGKFLFVSNANQNTVSVLDIERVKEIETINAGLTPDAPPGSTPNSVALSDDGAKLFIANADNNCLAVMDVSLPGKSKSLGFIPTGWYPTAVRIVSGEDILLVANGKGGTSKPNPQGPNPYQKDTMDQYIARLLLGTVSKIAVPSQTDMSAYTQAVFENSPLTNNESGKKRANIPEHVFGKNSPIKHVIYIIRENRTYDQVFGDISGGNGDAALCLFGKKVTPNAHALVKQFTLFDNFYADAEVSADGHNWSNGAYATDYVEKNWPTNYGHRGGEYEFEGGYPIAYPENGYMWDNCKRNNVTYRSYGEFAKNGKTKDDEVTATIESLDGHVAPHYRSWDLNYSDVDRVNSWIKEFDEYERNGNMPQYQVIKLPNDHTNGTGKNHLTPRAMIAQNDYALGLLVEHLTKSKLWSSTALFVVEDDAQNGADHVDAHRTVALVISPYTKRGYVDHEMYSTSSMIRTMELFLGLPPMSQYDASALPMYNSFMAAPDTTAFNHVEPAYDIFEKNMADAYGQQRSDEMDFSREDAIDEASLNEILWCSIKGLHSPVPAPVRGAFVRVYDKDDDDD
jgi:DNA-binding beta-propeller fold protein YncE/phospholipase C